MNTDHSVVDAEHSAVSDEEHNTETVSEFYHNGKADSPEQCSSDQSDNNNLQHCDYCDGKFDIQHLHN